MLLDIIAWEFGHGVQHDRQETPVYSTRWWYTFSWMETLKDDHHLQEVNHHQEGSVPTSQRFTQQNQWITYTLHLTIQQLSLHSSTLETGKVNIQNMLVCIPMGDKLETGIQCKDWKGCNPPSTDIGKEGRGKADFNRSFLDEIHAARPATNTLFHFTKFSLQTHRCSHHLCHDSYCSLVHLLSYLHRPDHD